MRGVWIAVILLAVLLTLVGMNAGYVVGTERELSRRADLLPDHPTEGTSEAIGSLRCFFEEHEERLSLSISFSLLDRVNELIASLDAYAQVGSLADYRATLQMLRDAILDLSRLERFSWNNIF